ncbi:MAG TPA: MBL fold metallo-hydrolase [Clostridiaceae bacterium]|nr:MBL fold metallo-hydrolase [Clostridiaceae bacterium]
MIFCSLYSGSSGNSIFTGSEKTKVLVDAGLTGKSIINAIENIGENPGELSGILVTHEHIDHVKGVGILSRKFNLPVFANAKTWEAMVRWIGPIDKANTRIIDGAFTLGDLDISTFRVPHDSAACIGYTIRSGQKAVSVATDIGVFTDEILYGIRESDLILIESNHDIEMVKFGPYPYSLKRRILGELGHLSNADSGKAILEVLKTGKKKIVLGHLSGTNNVPELAYKTVENIIVESGLVLDRDVILSLASRIRPSSYSEV